MKLLTLGICILAGLGGCAAPSNSIDPTQQMSEIQEVLAPAAQVLAIVNGKEITTAELVNIDLDTLTAEQSKQAIDTLINRRLFLEQALKEGFDKQEHIVASIRSSAETLIVTQYLAKVTAGFYPSDDELRSIYAAKYSNSTAEYKLGHILLPSKESGLILIDELVNGGDFSTLATEHSQDMVSTSKGGDLGWVATEAIAPSLLQEIARLKKGEVSGRPVQSPFGWHILKLEDKRGDIPPAFKEIAPSLRQEAMKIKVKEYLQKLKTNATIEVRYRANQD